MKTLFCHLTQRSEVFLPFSQRLTFLFYIIISLYSISLGIALIMMSIVVETILPKKGIENSKFSFNWSNLHITLIMSINATTMALKRKATTKDVMKELLMCWRPLHYINQSFLQKKSICTTKYNQHPENNNESFKSISTCQHASLTTCHLSQKRIDRLKHPYDYMSTDNGINWIKLFDKKAGN